MTDLCSMFLVTLQTLTIAPTTTPMRAARPIVTQ
jgi:hypothetical protein